MSKFMFLMLMLLVTLSNAVTLIDCSDNQDSIRIGQKYRTFVPHLPTNYHSTTKYPLVLALHGGGVPNGYQSICAQSELTAKADSAHFILVYPEGQKITGVETFNAGGCCDPAAAAKVDDVQFISILLDTLFRRYSIDTTRVYATGFSNGALMDFVLADRLSGRFAAIAPVAGDLVYFPWNPSRPVPIISFHSYLDSNILYYGGLTQGATGTVFPPQDSIFDIISTNYACQIKKETLFHDTTKYDHFIYRNCSQNVVIDEWVSYDGAHSWPGGRGTAKAPVSTQFSATDLMWTFFQKYTIPGPTATVANPVDRHAFSSGVSSSGLPVGNLDIVVYDLTGKIVQRTHAATLQSIAANSGLRYGVYLVKAGNNATVYTSKLLIGIR